MMKHTRLPQDNFKTQKFWHTWEFNTDCLAYVSLHYSRLPQHWQRITSPQQTSSTLTTYHFTTADFLNTDNVSLHHSRPPQHWLSTYHFTPAGLVSQKLKINNRTFSQMRIVMLYHNTCPLKSMLTAATTFEIVILLTLHAALLWSLICVPENVVGVNKKTELKNIYSRQQ